MELSHPLILSIIPLFVGGLITWLGNCIWEIMQNKKSRRSKEQEKQNILVSDVTKFKLEIEEVKKDMLALEKHIAQLRIDNTQIQKQIFDTTNDIKDSINGILKLIIIEKDKEKEHENGK